MPSHKDASLSRRELLGMCAGAGSLALTSLAPGRTAAASATAVGGLQDAADLLHYDLPAGGHENVARALQQALDQFRPTRTLAIDASIEPAVVFRADRRHGE